MNKTLKTLLVSMILLSSVYAMAGVTFAYFTDTETSTENTVTVGTWGPPDVSDACPSLYCLWPPNHQFVGITIGCIDDPEDDFEITIINITSDEPTDGCGDGNFMPDAYGLGTNVASLRAERSGSGNPCGNYGHDKPGYGDGRVYMITFIASNYYGDAEGNVTVCVPHDYHGECNCTPDMDNGQYYNATVNNTWIENP